MEGNPVRAVAGCFGYVDHAYDVSEGFVIVLVGRCHGIGKGHQRIREVRVCHVAQCEVRCIGDEREPWRRVFRIGRVEYFHVVAVRAFADDDDVRTFCDACAGIDEGHLLHVLIQVVREFLEELEFASLAVHRTDDSDREDVDDLTVEAAEEKDEEDAKSDEVSFGRAAERRFHAARCLYYRMDKGEGNGKDKEEGKDGADDSDRRSHRGQEIMDFLHMGGTDGHHGEHVHFPAKEDVVADIDEGADCHEEGEKARNEFPEETELRQALIDFLRNCQVDVRKPESNAAQDIVIAEVLLFRKRRETVRPGEGRHPEDRQHRRPWEEFLQERFVKDREKAQGNNEENQNPHAQTRLDIASKVREIPAQMKDQRNQERQSRRPG